MAAKKNTRKKKDPSQKEMPTAAKFVIAIVWDILDFTIFRIPVVGTLTDIVGGLVALKLFGILGAAYWWEVFDITDQLDAEVPTMTAIAIVTSFRGK